MSGIWDNPSRDFHREGRKEAKQVLTNELTAERPRRSIVIQSIFAKRSLCNELTAGGAEDAGQGLAHALCALCAPCG